MKGADVDLVASRGHSHVVEFYETEPFLAATVADFLHAGLTRADATIVVATGPHREAFSDALRELGVDVDAATLTSRLVVLDARETLAAFMADGGPDAGRFRETISAVMDRAGAGSRPVRVYGEMVSVLWGDGDVASAIALEDLWNDLAAEREFTLLCAYPMSAFDDPADAAAFARVCAQHTDVIPSEGYTALPLDDDEQRRRVVAGLQREVRTLRRALQPRAPWQRVGELHRADAPISTSAVPRRRADGEGTLDLAQPRVEHVLRSLVRVLGAEDSANARSLAYVWGFAATCLTASLLFPHPVGANELGLVVIAVLGYLGAAAMFVHAGALPQAAMELITYLGQGLIAALTLFWGAPEAPFLWFQAWLIVHSFHFLPPVRATLQVGFAVVLFVVVTLATHTMFPAAASVVGVGSLVSIGLLVGGFRVHVDDLLRALAASAASDPLTGLANRRAFDEAFASERARSARDGISSAVLLLDCNRLKALNDRAGHGAGDEALMRVARAISANVRAVDTAARVGGDEFAVLLSAPDPGAAVAIGERIRRTVANTTSADGITVSIGVVELPTEASVDLTSALAAADRAMYQAKRQGASSVSLGGLVDAPPDNAQPDRFLAPLAASPGALR